MYEYLICILLWYLHMLALKEAVSFDLYTWIKMCVQYVSMVFLSMVLDEQLQIMIATDFYSVACYHCIKHKFVVFVLLILLEFQIHLLLRSIFLITYIKESQVCCSIFGLCTVTKLWILLFGAEFQSQIYISAYLNVFTEAESSKGVPQHILVYVTCSMKFSTVTLSSLFKWGLTVE